MKLQTQLFLITNLKGAKINVEYIPIVIALNGERLPTSIQDIFSELEFDDGEIYGNSLLSYYNINEDGSLEVEGSKVQLLNAETDEPILVKKIKRPGVHNDGNISFENIQYFVEYFKIAKPDEVFYNLNDTEKQIFISDRVIKENDIKNATSALKASEEEAKAIDRKKAEAALKASIDPSYLQDNKAYIATQSFYAGLDWFKEYINDKHHLFYGEDPNQSFCLLIKRGADWWEEIREEKSDIIDKNEKEVIIEFMDGENNQRLRLDLEAGQIEIIKPEAIEHKV